MMKSRLNGLNNQMNNNFIHHIPDSILSMDKKIVGHTAKLVYSYIASLTYRSKICYATNDHIASKLNLSKRTIQRALKELENVNLIEIKKDNKYKSQRVITIQGDKQGKNNDTYQRQKYHTGMTSMTSERVKNDSQINNINNYKNNYYNNKDYAKSFSKPSYDCSKDDDIKRKNEAQTNYIRNFKANNKIFNCYKCNCEVQSELIDESSGIYQCQNCHYAVKIPMPRF